ncbi:MAG: Uncharacterized protein XD72_1151 [Methanothrix harundinacea]|jgi:hypothetical protein|uniref:Uncharacterized protein n=1 Tax=Methanothrix harundinacea TaxID=301375 RepID=A0A101FUC4_9EURY|nr:MAG: Uncharacterized protein XD72_1151 [Methanothrix harundinacea]KUK95751.1 MAG: Uncharacterized protein XE07_1601 [Methanothrix harundinacea]
MLVSDILALKTDFWKAKDDMNQETRFGILMLLALALLQMVLPVSPGMAADGFNGTTYILSKSEAEVIVPANGSSFNLTLPFKSEIVLFDSQGSEVPVEAKVHFWRGSYQYQVVSEERVKGHLNYTFPIADQRFVAYSEEGSAVRVILPTGYATGDPLLGKARPKPEEVETLGDRTVLIWTNPAKRTMIDVSFYRDDAPRAFRLFLLLLVFLAGVLALEHLASIRRLRSVREEADEDRDEEEGGL